MLSDLVRLSVYCGLVSCHSMQFCLRSWETADFIYKIVPDLSVDCVVMGCLGFSCVELKVGGPCCLCQYLPFFGGFFLVTHLSRILDHSASDYMRVTSECFQFRFLVIPCSPAKIGLEEHLRPY